MQIQSKAQKKGDFAAYREVEMKSFCLFFCILAMVLFASSGDSPAEMKEVENGGRCMVVMDPNGCNLLSCKQGCLQQNNGNGVCLANIKEGYQCVCYINC